ncbi:hypothetical protein V2E39_19760, partial [Chryseobacterium arthrosphaerae]
MKKVTLTILVSLTTFFFACKKEGQKTLSNSTKIDSMSLNHNNSIEKILENQIMNGYAIKEKGLDMIS